VTVTSLDLRPGGDLIYVMTAVAPEQVAFMKQGRACRQQVNARSTLHRGLTTKPAGLQGLWADFVAWRPRPYESRHRSLRLQATADGVKLTIHLLTPCMTKFGPKRARARGTRAKMRKLDAFGSPPFSENSASLGKRQLVFQTIRKLNAHQGVPAMFEKGRFHPCIR